MSEEIKVKPERVYVVAKTTLENNIDFFKFVAQNAFSIFAEVPSVNFEVAQLSKSCTNFEIEIPSAEDDLANDKIRLAKNEFDEFASDVVSKVTNFSRENYDEVSSEQTLKAEEYITILEETKASADGVFALMSDCTNEMTL